VHRFKQEITQWQQLPPKWFVICVKKVAQA